MHTNQKKIISHLSIMVDVHVLYSYTTYSDSFMEMCFLVVHTMLKITHLSMYLYTLPMWHQATVLGIWGNKFHLLKLFKQTSRREKKIYKRQLLLSEGNCSVNIYAY